MVAASLERELGNREAARAEAFADLVAKLAAGKKVAVDDVERIVSDAGRTNAELLKAVEVAQGRAARRAEREKLPEIAARMVEIDATVEQANAELLAAQETHAAIVAPLQAERRRVAERHYDLEKLDDVLAVECPDRELVARFDKVVAELRQLAKGIGTATSDRDRVQAGWSALAERNSDRRQIQGATVDNSSVKDAREALDRCESRLQALLDQRTELEAERDELWRRRSEA